MKKIYCFFLINLFACDMKKQSEFTTVNDNFVGQWKTECQTVKTETFQSMIHSIKMSSQEYSIIKRYYEDPLCTRQVHMTVQKYNHEILKNKKQPHQKLFEFNYTLKTSTQQKTYSILMQHEQSFFLGFPYQEKTGETPALRHQHLYPIAYHKKT